MADKECGSVATAIRPRHAREMCRDCPFRPGTKAFPHREGWVSNSTQLVFEEGLEVQPHGCHMLEDALPCKPENICVGHQDWINGIRHEEVK